MIFMRATKQARPAWLIWSIVGLIPLRASGHADLEFQIVEVSKEIAQNPKDATLYVKRGELFRVHENWDAALSDFNKAAKLDPEIENINLFRGKTYLESGRLDMALPQLETFLNHQPNSPDGLLLRARTLAKLGRQREAADGYSRAIQALNDAHLDAQPEDYIDRSRALMAAGKSNLSEAIRGLDEGIAHLGQVATIQLEAIELEIKREEFDAALERVDQVYARSPRKDYCYAQRGEILTRAGRKAEAQKALAAIEALTPARRRAQATIDLEGQVRSAIEKLQTPEGRKAGP